MASYQGMQSNGFSSTEVENNAILNNANPSSCEVQPDTRTLEELYEVAQKEIGDKPLIIYAGGDSPRQGDILKHAFQAAFPKIKMEIIVDLSKFHDARIDLQLANRSLVPDIVQLQSLQDFTRWKSEDCLLNYKVIDWDHIYDGLKDPDGAYTGVLIVAFSNNLNTAQLSTDTSEWPTEALDYLKPMYKNKLIMTYPNDDDAVLYLFKKITEKYGFEYLNSLVAQNVTWVRGTQVPLDRVTAGDFLATMTAANSLIPIPGKAQFVLPKKDPFVIWAQTAAILKYSPHPETAKLYLSFMVSKAMQSSGTTFSVRDDIEPPKGYKSIWDYKNGNPLAFPAFMADRAAVERFKNQVSLIVGEVVGPNPNGNLGTHPSKAPP